MEKFATAERRRQRAECARYPGKKAAASKVALFHLR